MGKRHSALENMGLIADVLNQYKTYRPVPATKNLLYHAFNWERKKSFGSKNADKTVYIIRPINDASPFYIGVRHNLMANYFYAAAHIQYAVNNGWVPVVDHKNYSVYTSICGIVNGIDNAWEYFFKQPFHVTLADAYESKNVILSRRGWVKPILLEYEAADYTNKALINRLNDTVKNIPLLDKIVKDIQDYWGTCFTPGEKVLGVCFRFAGHSKLSSINANGHPIAPDVGQLMDIVEQMMHDWGMDKVFFASDEANAVKQFKEKFGTRLVALDRKRSDALIQYNPANPNPMYAAAAMYDTTLAYITEMEMLARCTCLIGSINTGLRYAVVRNNAAYEHVKIIDCGRFPDRNKKT